MRRRAPLPALGFFFALGCHGHGRVVTPPRAPVGHVELLADSARAPHAYGRTGDLVLVGTDGARVVFATQPDAPGHRPLRGAMLDATIETEPGAGASDRADPLIWWRVAWIDAEGTVHPLLADRVEAVRCATGDAGVRASGTVDGVALERTVCARPGGAFDALDRLSTPGVGAALADELNTGSAVSLIEHDGARWDERGESRFIAFAESGIAACVSSTAPLALARRTLHIAAEVFHDPVHSRIPSGNSQAIRTLRLSRGDALAALAMAPVPMRTVHADGGALGGSLELRDDAHRAVASGALAAGVHDLALPASLGTRLAARDARGINAPEAALGARTSLAIGSLPAGRVRMHYTVDGRAPLAVHVMVRGLDGTADPTLAPLAPSPSVRAAGRSLYLRAGDGIVALAPGRYRVTASHGPAYALSTRDVQVDDGGDVAIADTVAPVVDTVGWTSADLHLHAAPSADSDVSLEDRVLALSCEGVEFAVATDHNRITDYAPALGTLGLDTVLATVPGDEVTTAGSRLLGHFNAFPLAPDAMLSPEDQVPAYYDAPPASVFAAARARGARVLEVNHPRMPPALGYFDQTSLDPRTGQAGPLFSDAFDAVEAFNGMWIETPERVREGVRDLVALARRGVRVAATGNSDSHHLLYEEAGWPRTYVRATAEPIAGRAERVLDGLLRHETTVSSGPFVEITVDGSLPGAVVRARGHSVRVHVRVRAPAWVPVERVEVWVDGEPARAIDVVNPAVDGVRAEADVVLPVAQDTVVLAWADAAAPLPDVLPYAAAHAIGFTGLVYVDGDGDGVVRLPSVE